MTAYQAAIRVLSRAFGGGANIPVKVHDRGARAVAYLGEMSTTGLLTSLVIAAHDEGVAVTIRPSGPGRVEVSFVVRDGRVGERHLTIEQAIIEARKEQP